MGAKILVVDDSAFIRKRCSKVVKELGFDVVEAATGAQAVAAFKEHAPRLVVMDITMPDMDGLNALAQMKDLSPDCRVVLLTALDQPDVIIEAMRYGAADYIPKPFERGHLAAAIREQMSDSSREVEDAANG